MYNYDEIEMRILYKAISDNNWPAAKAFIDRYPIVLDVEFGASRGETPLHVAAKFGHVGVVEDCNALAIPNRRYNWGIPVLLAFRACLKVLGRYLYSVTPLQLFTENRNLGTVFFATCLLTGELEIVLDLLCFLLLTSRISQQLSILHSIFLILLTKINSRTGSDG
ncbi:hypothetical protein K1719_047390, partial [Acacia pycnantha]